MVIWRLVVLAVLTAHVVATDSVALGAGVVVVCPDELRAALEPWVAYRRQEGHAIAIVDARPRAEALRVVVQEALARTSAENLLLVGDVVSAESPLVPANYATAEVNVRWGSPAQLATDSDYADVTGDGIPDVAVGRLSVQTAVELTTVVAKIVRYESRSPLRTNPRRFELVAGDGGFGGFADRVIETAARRIVEASIPDPQHVRLTRVGDLMGGGGRDAAIRAQLSRSSLAWIYMGHGTPYGLAGTGSGNDLLLSVRDLAQAPATAPESKLPLAVLLACYTGAFDAPRDCLAEVLLRQSHGPVAVIAATRVTMPYGNAVLGHELLTAYCVDRCETVGEVLLLAQRRTLSAPPEDPIRTTLDQLARGLAPPPVALEAERREHVQMYHLLGDPLLRLDGLPPVRVARERF